MMVRHVYDSPKGSSPSHPSPIQFHNIMCLTFTNTLMFLMNCGTHRLMGFSSQLPCINSETSPNRFITVIIMFPGGWFYLKKIGIYVLLRLRKWRRKRKSERVPESATGRAGYGFKSLESEEDMECPQALGSDKHVRQYTT